MFESLFLIFTLFVFLIAFLQEFTKEARLNEREKDGNSVLKI